MHLATRSDVATTPRLAPTGVQTVVELRDARRNFGERAALDGLNLSVPAGQVTVLLGPNGAGKTTAIRVITGAMSLNEGSVRTFGLDPARNGEVVRRRCGVVAAKPALYDRLTGRDNLRYSAALYGLNPDKAPIDESAHRFGIHGALANQVGGYSTGMKTRLALARSVLHDPDLLLLDEPTSGLDPESSVAVLGLIRDLSGHGKTVVLCTHLLLEAEGLADQVVVLDAGRDLVAGEPNELAQKFFPTLSVKIEVDNPETLDVVGRAPGVQSVRRDGDVHSLTAEIDTAERVPDLVAAIVAAGGRIRLVEPSKPNLEDLYFAVRGVRRGAMTTVETNR